MKRTFMELSEAEEVRLGTGMVAALLPIAAPPYGLLAVLSAVANPWQAFVQVLASMADVPAGTAAGILDRAEAGRGWAPGLIPGMRLWHIDGGPATAGADVGLVQLAPGVAHPEHEHLGGEEVFVLAGEYLDSAGRRLRAGDREVRGVGEPHSFTAGPYGVTLAVVLREGIAFPNPDGGAPIVYRG